MSTIVIGKTGNHNVTIDLNVLLSTRALLTADSGGGKTFALKRIIEQAFGKIQIIVIDPEGEFAPMREKLDFVLVGKGGDRPAAAGSATLMAQTLLKVRASAICDIYDMKPSERHAWVRLFIDGLIEAPKETRHPCLVIVDEAHMFCPEHGKGESEASDAMTGLCTRGRKRLLCPLFSTQRLATLSKDASSMLLNRMIGPTFEDVNRKRAAEILSVTREDQHDFFQKIQTLEPGYFFCLGRAISKERILAHIGPISTPHGQEALKYEIEPPPATANILALLPKFSEVAQAVEDKARTVTELKTEIRNLTRQLKSRPAETREVQVADPKAVERAVRPLQQMIEEAMKVIVKINTIGFDGAKLEEKGVTEALRRAAKEIYRLADAGLQRRSTEFETLKKDTHRLLEKMKRMVDSKDLQVTVDVKKNEPFTVSQKPAQNIPNSISHYENNGNKLRAGAERMLAALATWHPNGMSEGQMRAHAGMKKSGTFSAYMSDLRKGYIEERGGLVYATDQGLSYCQHIPAAPQSTEEVLEVWKPKLRDGARRMLDALVQRGGEAITKEELGEMAGLQKSGTFSAYLSDLKTARLAVVNRDGTVSANRESLFL